MNDDEISGPSAWSDLATEGRHPASLDLDRADTESIVESILHEDRRGLDRASAQRTELAQAAEWLAETWSSGGVVCFLGAGTSGRLGIIEAAECPPTFGTDPDRIVGVIAGGPDAVFAAREGAEDDVDAGREAASDLNAGDLLIAISASAVTPFVNGALTAARDRGVRSVLLTCAAPTAALASMADVAIALDTGPEILAGSTRLKAGSATKAALNAITTAAMVRCGKVFENLMVDLRPGSAKLRDRTTRIVATAGRVPLDDARRLLDEADGEVKTAIVMARVGIRAEAARRRLERADGFVRPAIGPDP